MTERPKTLEEVEAINDPAVRARAVGAYITRLRGKEREAVAVRRKAIAALLEANGRADWGRPAVVAKACGVSVSTVKAVRYDLDDGKSLDG